MDVHPKSIRSKNMAAIGSKNTKPELILRRALHKKGFRYRLHTKVNGGKPDLILKQYNAAVFVHGCFWHKHNCEKFKWPKTREAFWKQKLISNQQRDQRIIKSLNDDGWRVAVVWECALSGRNSPQNAAVEKLSMWLWGDVPLIEISGPLSV
jgi:DNA mismatch endonuclease, patch repair protein